LVLNGADDSEPQRVEVAYGTSKKTTQKYAGVGEFELTPRDGEVFQRAGLIEESKLTGADAYGCPTTIAGSNRSQQAHRRGRLNWARLT